MIHKYLKELVENNNRIIIPDFGAFMVQDTPEGKQISFNDFLKFNDGLLVNQIIKSEKISKNEATEHIKTFVKEVEAAFSKKEAYKVEEIGFLIKDDHGNIKFESKLKASSPPVQPTDAKPTIVLDEKKATPKTISDKKTEVKAEAPKVETKSVPVNKEIKTTETKVASKTTPESQTTQKDIKTAPTAKKEPTKIPSKPTNPAKQPIKATATKPPVAKMKSTNNSNTALIIIIVAAVIILGGGGFAAFKLHWFGLGQEPEPIVEVVPMEEPIVDSLPAVDTTEIIEDAPQVIEEDQVDPNTKHYYIVAGSFKVPSNAENFSIKLIDEGYTSEVIVRSNGYHTVSYKTLYDWNEALDEWRTMRGVNSQTWILVK